MSEKSFVQHDVNNKQLKEENKKLRKQNETEKLEMRNENKQFEKNKIKKNQMR